MSDNFRQDWNDHYKKARTKYVKKYQTSPKKNLYQFGINTINPSNSINTLIELSKDYLVVVESLGKKVNDAFKDVANTWKQPKSKSNDFAMRIAEPLKIDEVGTLAGMIIPQLEKNLFNSYIQVDHVYIYRNQIIGKEPTSSWLWHYDNHPSENVKVMIYLTDVDKESAPFQYLMSPERKPVIVHTPDGSPLWPESRVPAAVIKDYMAQGYKVKSVTGKKGTIAIFDDNIIHRATTAKSHVRDVVVYQIKPSLYKMRPHLSSAWTGSFQHEGINKDPNDIKPQPRE